MDIKKVRLDFLRYNAEAYEAKAAEHLKTAHHELRCANELDAVDHDGDAYLTRENAYWEAQEATHCYGVAKDFRDLLAKTA